jgi:hypothetical protein
VRIESRSTVGLKMEDQAEMGQVPFGKNLRAIWAEIENG